MTPTSHIDFPKCPYTGCLHLGDPHKSLPDLPSSCAEIGCYLFNKVMLNCSARFKHGECSGISSDDGELCECPCHTTETPPDLMERIKMLAHTILREHFAAGVPENAETIELCRLVLKLKDD